MTKQQMKKWRKRREHVNARCKAANRAKNERGKSLPTDSNPMLNLANNTRSRQAAPQMSALEAYMTKFAMMMRRSRNAVMMIVFSLAVGVSASGCTPYKFVKALIQGALQ